MKIQIVLLCHISDVIITMCFLFLASNVESGFCSATVWEHCL